MQQDTPVDSSLSEAMLNADGNSYTLIIEAPEKEQDSSSRLRLVRVLGIVAIVVAFSSLLWYVVVSPFYASDPVPSDSAPAATLSLKEYLAQQEAARPAFRNPPLSTFYPNLEMLGRGYNVFNGDPRAPGVQSDPGIMREFPIFQIWNENTAGVQITPGERCTTNFESTMVYGLSSYRNTLEASVGVSANVGGLGGLLGGSFSSSSSWNSVRSATVSNRRITVDSIAECSFYEASLVVPPSWSTSGRAPLSQSFQDAVTFLASTSSPSTRQFEEVIDFFGTHAIFNRMRMGSLVGSRREVTEATVLEFQRRGWLMETAASLTMGLSTFGTDISNSRQRDQASEFQNQVVNEHSFTIGTTPRRQAWDSGGGRTNPSPVAFDLLDLAHVIGTFSDHPQLQAGMQRALDGYCRTLRRRGQRVSCDDPLPDPVPVDSPVSQWRTCVRHTVAHGGGGGSEFGVLHHPTVSTAAAARMSQIRLGLARSRIGHLAISARLANGNTWNSRQIARALSARNINIPAGRRVTRVRIRSGNEVDWLEFRFDDGTTHSYGGTGGGATHTFDFAASGRRNPRLMGFHGRANDRIDRLGFVFAYEVAAGSNC